MMTEQRKVIDCRWFPSENKCTLAISGSEEEVMKAAVDHAVKVHGEKDTPEFRKELQHLLKEAKD
jgi:predicted small metal-binding protein